MQVTFVEALDGLMPGFDPEIGKLAQRILINPRKIDYHTGVLAKKVSATQNCCGCCYTIPGAQSVDFLHGRCMQITPARDGKPVIIELVDTKTKEPRDVLEVGIAHLVA